MSQEVLPPAARELQARGIPFRLFRHPHPPASLEEAAASRGQRVDQVVRSLVFRAPGEAYVLLLLPGGYRAHWPTLRRTLGVRRLTLATPDEVLRVTGAPVGAVAPWGWPHPPRYVLLDEAILKHAEVSTGSGVPGLALILRTEDFVRALPRHRIGRFGQPVTSETPGGGP